MQLSHRYQRHLAVAAAMISMAGDAMAQSAMSCVSLQRTSSGGMEIANRCPYVVSASWCVEGHDCKRGADIFSNTWNIRAGGTYPVSGSRSGGQVIFGACEGRDVSVRATGRTSFTCD